MFEKLTAWSLEHRLIVLVLLVGLMAGGIVQYLRLPTDAFPDISPIMVPVFAEAHGMAPEEIERLITIPIESAMSGLPGVTRLSSTSAFGLAVVSVYFADDMDIYFCRQIVAERLTGAMADLPELHEPPMLGPIASGLGEVFMYYLTIDDNVETGGKDANTYLRELNDWQVKLQLQAVPGVTEILSMGGHVLQYQVRVDPHALNRYGLQMSDIVSAITANNGNVGGQFLVRNEEELLVRGVGLLEGVEDLRDIQVKVVDGTPIRLREVAEVGFGNEVRRGAVVLDGEREIVAGIVLKLFGENTSEVIARLRKKIIEVQETLPAGVHLVPYYDQSRLVDNAVATVRNAMLLGGLLVMLSLLAFLGNLRAALIVAIALPFCALVAFLLMAWQGLSANLMSLGGIAIAIGMLGDGAIVMVESIHRHLSQHRQGQGTPARLRIVTAAGEVGRPILFSVVIVIIVFLPVLSLQGIEGKMFSPMAVTIIFALLGSLVAALVLAPVLCSLLLRPGAQEELTLLRWLKARYSSVLHRVLAHRRLVVVLSLAALAGSMVLLGSTGTEFIPALEEGVVQINITMSPSIALAEATTLVSRMQRTVGQLQEVQSTVAKIGRPEAGSHPHPVSFGMIQAVLRPEQEWRDHHSKEQLVSTLERELSRYPGVQLNFTQPIQNLFDELLSGVRTQLAIKLAGDDLQVLRETAAQIKETIEGVPGLVDLATEQSFGQPQVQVRADRKACARYNVAVADILELVELAVGGEVVDELYQGSRRFGIHVRYQEQYRNDITALRSLLVRTADGALIPLSQVAEVTEMVGPIQVNREHNMRRWTISANVRGRDLGSVVNEIKARVAAQITLPPGYTLSYGGQFKNQQRAMRRLLIIVPTALALIFLLLHLALGNLRFAALIFVNVPMALIGGVLGLHLWGEYLSVPASIGFVALLGIAVQNGLVLVTRINQLVTAGRPVREAIVEGAVVRLRPVLMTALTTMLGLTPLLLAGGIGSEVQRPLAVVVVFGLLSSTFLTLVLIPALYERFAGGPARNGQ